MVAVVGEDVVVEEVDGPDGEVVVGEDVVVEVEDLEIFLSPDKLLKYVQMQQQKD